MKLHQYKFKGIGNLFAFTFFVFLFLSCAKEVEPPEGFVAQVNDSYLLKDHLAYSVPEGLPEDASFSLKKNIISKWIEDEVLYQSAMKEEIQIPEKDQYLLDNYRKALIIQKYLEQKLNKDYKISQKEIEDYYRDHRNEFQRSEDEVHIIHLLLENRDNAIFREIGQADDLMEIIKKYYFEEKSTPENPNGDLGYVPLSTLPAEFDRVIRRMKTGTISSPIRTNQGYHFIQLLDFPKKGSQIDIDLVSNEIMLRLKNERKEQELDRLKKELKENMQIQTYLSKIEQ